MSTISSSTTSTTAYKVTADTTGALVLQTGATPTTAVTIDASQNVGIGTTSPSQKLEVAGNVLLSNNQYFGVKDTTGAAVGFPIYTGSNDAIFGYLASGTTGISTYQFRTGNNVERMRIDSSGNVGIGQSSITQAFGNYTQLNISGSSGATIQLQTGSTTRTNIVSDANALYIAQLAGNMQFAVGGTGTGTERMRIDASGNLLLNTTGQVAQGKFSVSFVGSTNQAASFNESSGAASWTTVLFQRLGTTIGSISNATSSTAYNTSSDYRLKNTIAPMTGALAKVKALKPVTYKWNIDDEAGEGFIAHELAEVCPHAVTGEKDAVDADGNPIYQGIDTSFLVATLTAAIQEQQALIQQLQADVAALKGASA